MGLDMYAFTVRKGVITEAVDFDHPEDEEGQGELHYWRKHPNLHGWMEDLYRNKGGKEPVFNCVNVQLTEEDIDKLEEDVKNDKLPKTEGFFFGQSQPEDKEGDLEFVKQAREAINDGYDVYYSSWW